MNLILLFPDDFTGDRRVVLTGRRQQHIARVLRPSAGESVVVGVAGDRIGTATVSTIDRERAELVDVVIETPPPPPLDVTLVLALPRPKVLNRVIAAVTSMGVKQIYLINAWRVEKSYWRSPRLEPQNLHLQAVLGLEQARDTVLPRIHLRRFFRRFVEDELPAIIGHSRALVAHPAADPSVPRVLATPLTLVIGPEGGFIPEEIESLSRAGCSPVSLGPRILRVETAIAALLGRV